MLGMFNPFKKRLPPIYKKEGGYRPWDDRQPPKKVSVTPFIIGCGLLLFFCGGLPTAAAFLALNMFTGNPDPTPTLDITNYILSTIDNRTATPTGELAAQVVTDTPEAMTPTVTANPEFTATDEITMTPAPQITVRSYSQNILPTYTPYPTYTEQPARIITVRESGGVQTVIQTQIVEQPVQQTVLAPVYVVVTATPSITPTAVMIPTMGSLWTMQPDHWPTREGGN